MEQFPTEAAMSKAMLSGYQQSKVSTVKILYESKGSYHAALTTAKGPEDIRMEIQLDACCKYSGCIVEARMLEHHSPHALKVNYKGS